MARNIRRVTLSDPASTLEQPPRLNAAAMIIRAWPRAPSAALAGVVVVAFAGWAWLAHMAAVPEPMGMDMGRWTAGMWGAAVLMWAVMMAAMMLPAALPMISVYAGAVKRGGGSVTAFVLGYLLVWTAFALAATVVQWGLEITGQLSPAMRVRSRTVAGAILVAAGAWQWTPWKDACLTRCRTPLAFLINEWREGAKGAVRMGARHGLFCVGCCWALMLVLYAVGVMNLAWVAGLSALVLLEKSIPYGAWLARVAGLALIALGSAMVLTA